MDIVSNKGSSLARVRELSEEERLLFMSPSLIGSEEYGLKQDFLSKVHQHHFWLACDCNKSKPAIMGVRLKEDYYHLFNINKRGVHDVNCPLFRMIKLEEGNTGSLTKKQSNRNNFVFHAEKREIKKDSNKSEKNTLGSASKSESENSLWVCLKRLIEISGVNKIGGNTGIGKHPRKQALIKATRSIRIGGMALSKIFRWGLDKHEEVCEIVCKITEDKSMPKGAPHGVVIAIIDGFRKDEFQNICVYKENNSVVFPSTCKIEINGKQGFEMSPPYLAIYTVVNTSESGEEIICEPQKCYITPIHSEATLVPVSSALERELLDNAISNIKYNLERGNKLIYERPVDPYVAPISKRAVLPTLVGRSGDREIFIDIDYVGGEGSEDDQVRVNAMHELAGVVRIDNDDEFKTKSFQSICLAAKHVIGI